MSFETVISSSPQPQDDGRNLSSQALLALAKDERYVEQGRRLVAQIMESWGYPLSFARSSLSSQTTTSWLVSAALYYLLASSRGKNPTEKATLGMQATGLMLVSSPQAVAAATANSHVTRLSQKIATIVLASAFVYYYYYSDWTRNDTDTTERQNGHGIINRYWYGNQAAAAANVDADLQQLCGNRRRLEFQRRRQQMIQRAQNHDNSFRVGAIRHPEQTTIGTNAADHGNQGRIRRASSSDRVVTFVCQKLNYWIVKSVQSTITAISSCRGGGPHDLQLENNSNSDLWSFGVWLLRLRLAYYCLGGRQTWSGGLGTLLSQSPNRQQQVRMINSQPTETNRSVQLMGLLIVSHATGQALRVISRQVLKWILTRRMQSDALPLRSGMGGNSDNDDNDDESLILTQHAGTHATAAAAAQPSSSAICCTICQERRTHASCSIHCGHVFCWHCLQLWVASKSQCPVCRKTCRPQDIMRLENY